MTSYEEFRREKENYITLKKEVDRVCREAMEGDVRDEADLEARIEKVRELCRKLLPDRVHLFDRVYQSRIRRLWQQFGKAESG
ncbi:MAG: hypothetical protein R6V10_03955 [bacterium]